MPDFILVHAMILHGDAFHFANVVCSTDELIVGVRSKWFLAADGVRQRDSDDATVASNANAG